jgi:hypothetical protein
MRANILLASVVVAALTTGSVEAQPSRIGNAVHGPNNEVIIGGKVVGQDPDPNVRLEIWRRLHSRGSSDY